MKIYLITALICFITEFVATYIYFLLKERNSPNNKLFRSFKKILNQFEYEDSNKTCAIFVLRDRFNNPRYRYVMSDNLIEIYNHLGEKICSGKI